MAAVANPNPAPLPSISRPGWGVNGPDDFRGMFLPRKNIQRTNSSSSISSASSASTSSTLVSTNGSTNGAPAPASGEVNGWPSATPRKRPQQQKSLWPAGKPEGQADFSRMAGTRQQMVGGVNGPSSLHQQSGLVSPQNQMTTQNAMSRQMMDPNAHGGQPVLYLLSLNGTFERKTIAVPFGPETLRIGRQTNMKTVPTPVNGYFDSKVLSRQHAEIWADRQGKIWIRDIKSSNGTFVNGTRLSAENRESEPHELQTSDHLELGIDIVSEDQKSVVHHKVAAKVEHAGFMNPTSSLLDMSFGELDPANGALMMQQFGGMPFRGRSSSQLMLGGGARMAGQANGMALQRGMLVAQPSTEAIVKRLHQEIRSARIQQQDLARTQQFIGTLLSKDDIKNDQRPEGAEPARPHMVNGNGVPFRSDPKARFSDPPAPPPQQPLPEKPDIANVPSLKRGATERPKVPPQSTSPSMQAEPTPKIIELEEALKIARRELGNQQAQMQEIKAELDKERNARVSAEEHARRLEESRASSTLSEGSANPILEETFDPPAEMAPPPDPDITMTDAPAELPQSVEKSEQSTNTVQALNESLLSEMKALRQQMDEFRIRAEKAEADRDDARETLADMVRKIRERDEEDARREARKSRSLSRSRNGGAHPTAGQPAEAQVDGAFDATPIRRSLDDTDGEQPTLSRANTITPAHSTELARRTPDPALVQSIPYASMVGVVLLGMGLMAYLNGWQSQPRVDR